MTEFDFDELDKAVNSLMSGVDTSKRNAAYDDPIEKVVTLDESVEESTTEPANASSPSDDSIVTSDSTAATPASIASDATQSTDVADEPAPTAPSLAVKRRGQFMDVIHPSSDMKTATPPVARRSITIQPVSQDLAPTPAPDSPATPESSDQSTSVDSEALEASTLLETVEPHERTGEPVAQSEDRESAPVNENENKDTPEDVLDLDLELIDPESPASEPAPLTTPFLPDAKVEKRPLGSGFFRRSHEPTEDDESESTTLDAPKTETEHTSISPDEPDAAPLETTNAKDAPDVVEKTLEEASQDVAAENPTDLGVPAEPEVVLPEELSSEVVALESADPASLTTSNAEPEIETKSPDIPEAVQPEEADIDVVEQKIAVSPETTQQTSASQSMAASAIGGSITQQYTVSENTGDQTNGAIYDTEHYHKPVADVKPAKKSSSVKVVVLLLVLLIIGALGGAAYFYFTL